MTKTENYPGNNEFRAHVQKVQAQKAAQAETVEDYEEAPITQLTLAALGEHQRALKQIQSRIEKTTFKRENFPQYDDYIDGILEANEGHPDPVITTLMIWAFDIGNIDRGLQLARYALEHKLQLPDRYKRTLGTVIAEEVAEASMAGTEVTADQFKATHDLTHEEDMPDEVRAKLFKALGLHQEKNENYESAHNAFSAAYELTGKKAGVIKLIEKMSRIIKNQAEKSTANDQGEEPNKATD